MSTKDEQFQKRLLATFRVEAEEHVRSMLSGLLGLEKESVQEKRQQILETVFRDAHSLKGAARSVNVREIESLCQQMESIFSALKKNEVKGTQGLYDLLHQAMDQMSRLVKMAGQEPGLPERTGSKELIRQLGNLLKPEETQKEAEAIVSIRKPDIEETTAISDTVRIPMDKLDPLLLQAEELSMAKIAMGQRASELLAMSDRISKWIRESSAWMDHRGDKPAVQQERYEWISSTMKSLQGNLSGTALAIQQDYRTLRRMADEHLEDMKKIIMLPVASVVEVFPKFIRDLARDQGKEVDLIMEGAEVEIDKRILEEMKAPLIHMVRNCLDHGIERPEERRRRNKPARGKIRLAFSALNNRQVEISVSDDGTGIDVDRIRMAALKIGILPQEEDRKLDAQAALGLIFRSGISTSPIITDLSGRGLGLAIVKDKVEKLGGNLSVGSRVHEGTHFRIILPMTLATFRGVLVRAGGSLFVIPSTSVEKTGRIKREDIRTIENRETIDFEGRIMSTVRLTGALGMSVQGNIPRTAEKGEKGYIPIVILSSANAFISFQVDEVAGEQQVLVKGLGRQLSRVRNISGATILGNGEIAAVLNVHDLIKSAVQAASTARPASEAAEPSGRAGRILVAEDSITSRTLLKNILESAGFVTATAVDGADAFTQLRSGEFDLVVSDVDMPRMNGFELTAKIRADKNFNELPVVLVTALESRDDRERGIDVGANAYIVKSSFDQSNLVETVRRLL